jgi:organic hydroperoxide reductase OsmC/OhrA
MKLEPKKYPYSTSLTWTGEHKGTLSSEGKPDLPVACPPEWGGHPNIWSPEDLFIGSIEVCAMTTLLFLADRERITLRSYSSEAEGKAGMIDGVFGFEPIQVKLKIGVSNDGDVARVGKLVPEIEKWCLVSKSLKPHVVITPEIFVED